MERWLLRILIGRALLFAVPFAVWFVWRGAARRAGREMGSTPWPWLVACGALLAALSLIGSVVLHPNRGRGTYVPAEVRADGRVTPGHFAPSATSTRANP